MIAKEKRIVLSAILALLLLFSAAAVTPSPAAADEPAASAPEVKTVDAETVDELLKAIAPNTTINLTGRSYNITEAQGYGVYGSAYYGWNDIYDDGWELQIENVQNLTIRAAHPGVEVVTVPRYACVMKFNNCGQLTLEGFTCGHTDGAGFCTGAVINLTGCRDVSVTGCDLYGCGTYGLEIDRSRGVHAMNTTIRDCSYGALVANASADILLDNCSVYGIEGYGGIFSYSGCRDCAVINTLVRSCGSSSLMELNTARNVYLGGCEIVGNKFNGMFFCSPYPVTVEGCVFKNNSCEYGWYDEQWRTSEHAVDPSGKTYSDEELEALTLTKNIVWSAPMADASSVQAPEVGEDGMIHVHTVDELLASIAPNASIYLENGVYNLSDAMGYGTDSGEYYDWMPCYDGPGLVIRNVENLTITGASPIMASIVAEPRYAEVLSFEDCRNISLSGFTAGHTQEISDCAGGVLCFMGSDEVSIENCSLYGCGVLGVTATNCKQMRISFTEIHHCSFGAFSLDSCRDVTIERCNVHDIPGSTYSVYNCTGVTADGVEIPDGQIC